MKLNIKVLMVCLVIFISNSVWATKVETATTEKLATAENLSEFEFAEPEYSTQEIQDRELFLKSEVDEMEVEKTLQGLFSNSNDMESLDNGLFNDGIYEDKDISIEIYQNSPLIKKQFLVVKQDGFIRFVFAVSAASPSKSTPGGIFNIFKQRWRHMSTLYPGDGENNMDHVSYFTGPIGFHSTVFGLYYKLGRADSHGCVRMARPEARAVYALVKSNLRTTRVISYDERRDPPTEEIDVIKKQLALDFNFIQMMLKSKNNGDVPYDSFNEYIQAKQSGNLGSQVIEITAEQDYFNTLIR